jgi:hypothetical protein
MCIASTTHLLHHRVNRLLVDVFFHLQTFVELAAPTLAAQYPSLLSVVLPNISHPSREIAEVGTSV